MAANRDLATTPRSLPPMLHIRRPRSALSYSKGSRGLFVPLRVDGIFTATTISPSSRLRPISLRLLTEVPFSRSYGVNLPSSLAVIHSSTLGYSPHPPVSVYGTGCLALSENSIFLRAWLPALSARPKARGTVGFQLAPTTFNALFRQRAAVSLPGLKFSSKAGGGILTASSSGYPFGLPLVPGLP